MYIPHARASLVAQKVKNLPAMQETQVQSLGREDPLEKRMATHSSIPVWRIPWTEEPDGLQFMGSQRVDTTEELTLLHFLFHLLSYSNNGINYMESEPAS